MIRTFELAELPAAADESEMGFGLSAPELESAGQFEWTEEELQYSIINSPTSPGDDRFRITARSKRPSTLMFPFNTICMLERYHLDKRPVSRMCDKPRGTMWGHSEKIRLADISPTHLRYVIVTCPGHSGSPIWLLGNNALRLLLGVHTNGPAGCANDPASCGCRATGAAVAPITGLNRGVGVTCEVIDYIVAWCREFRVGEPAIDHLYKTRFRR